MAIRNPITGPSRLASAPASPTPSAPAAIRMTAVGPAATASGQPRGLITAHASTASSASTDTVSPMAAFSGPSLQPALTYRYHAMANAGESIGIDDGFSSRNPGAVTEERAQAERFAELFRAVYLTFHRRDGPRSQLAGASRAVLEHLALAGPLTVGEAAAHMDRAQSVISEIVTHLERQGLLEREDDPADRRRTLIWLTPVGHEALRRDREVLGVDHLARTMARLPPGRADDLIAGLRSLVDLATPKEE
jgi:DNA-binding MarR family transcriptional regulator